MKHANVIQNMYKVCLMKFFTFEAKIIVEILVTFKITLNEQKAEGNT